MFRLLKFFWLLWRDSKAVFRVLTLLFDLDGKVVLRTKFDCGKYEWTLIPIVEKAGDEPPRLPQHYLDLVRYLAQRKHNFIFNTRHQAEFIISEAQTMAEVEKTQKAWAEICALNY